MSVKTVIVGVLALVFGLACAIGVKAYLDSQANRPAKIIVEKAKSATVVVATHTIPHGKTIVADDVEYKEWPADMAPKGNVASVEDVINRAALGTFFEGEPILVTKIASGPLHDMSSHLKPGMRAFTIHIPTVGSGVAGFILPGNKVDVLLTVTDLPSLKETGAMTVSLLQAVEILAVDQQTEIPTSNKMDPQQMHSVTLAVTAAQASKLALAGSKGTMNLALRNPNDQEETQPAPVTLSDLQFLKEAGVAPEVTPVAQPVVSLATHLTAGMRAVTIKATLASGVAGLVLPKDHVDVLLTTSESTTSHDGIDAVSILLLQDVQVLAVDQVMDTPAMSKTEPKAHYFVTLAVTPTQAGMLALAESKGTLSLALRNPDDSRDVNAITRVSASDLKLPEKLPHQTEPKLAQATPVTPAAQVLWIRTLRGSQNGLTTVYPLYETDNVAKGTRQ